MNIHKLIFRRPLWALALVCLGAVLLAPGIAQATEGETVTEPSDGASVLERTAGAPSMSTPNLNELQDGDFIYTVDDDGAATVTGYTGSDTELTIPARLGSATVTAIAESAFEDNTTLEAVTLPDTVTKVGNFAFANCTALASVDLGDSVESIGAGCFLNDAALPEITLPASFAECTMADLGEGAITPANGIDTGTIAGPFAGCASLATVTFTDGATTIPAYLLAGCSSMKVTLVIPDSVTFIDDNATGPQWTTIVAHPDTAAADYASRHHHEFVDATIRATSVSLDQSSISLKRGDSTTLTATVQPYDCEEAIDWTISSVSIATIAEAGVTSSSSGLAGAISVTSAGSLGTTTITVTCGSYSATCSVTVWQPVTSIDLNRGSFEMEAGEVRQLVAECLPTDATNKQVNWSSSDTSVATVNTQTGLVTGVGEGTATIIATAADGEGARQTCTVTVTNNAYSVDDPTGIATPHPYANENHDSWSYMLAGAKEIAVTFDSRTSVENTFDYIEVYDGQGNLVGTYTGTELAGTTLNISGNTVRVKLVADEMTNDWGFAVTSVTAVETDGFVVENGATYYYVNGAPYKGLLELDDGWHYFDSNTGAMVIGLVTLPDGRTVYFDADGVMLTGEVMLSDGMHYFDPTTGALEEPDTETEPGPVQEPNNPNQDNPTGTDQPDGDQPNVNQPSGDQPSGNQPSGDQPSGNDQPDNNQPADNQPSGDQPTGNQPDSSQPSGDQPSGDQPSGDQPSGDQPSGNDQPSSSQPDSSQPSGDQPSGNDQPSTSQPDSSQPSGDQPSGDQPSGDQPDSSQPSGDQPSGDQPSGDQPSGDQPSDTQPASDQPSGNQPDNDQPSGDQPSGDQPSGDQPSGDQPDSSQPAGDQPSGDQPDTSQPAGDQPSGDQPSGDQPSGDQPSGDQPSGDQPSGDQPSGDQPSGDQPDNDQPDSDQPDNDQPDDGNNPDDGDNPDEGIPENMPDTTVATVMANEFIWAYPATSFNADDFDASDEEQLEALVLYGINAVVQSRGDGVIETIDTDDEAADADTDADDGSDTDDGDDADDAEPSEPVEAGPAGEPLNMRLSAEDVLEAIAQTCGLEPDLDELSSDRLTYDGEYVYFGESALVYGNAVLVQVTDIEEIDEEHFAVTLDVYEAVDDAGDPIAASFMEGGGADRLAEQIDDAIAELDEEGVEPHRGTAVLALTSPDETLVSDDEEEEEQELRLVFFNLGEE